MFSRFFFRLTIGFLCLVCLVSCSKGGRPDQNSPIVPPVNPEITEAQTVDSGASGHYLWAYFMVTIDPDTLEAEVVPVRLAEGHFNVLGWLETGPCFDCMEITGVSPDADGNLDVGIKLRHPLSNPIFTGFDVRGIAMFDGSHYFPETGKVMSDRTLGEGEVINADGYTSLFNPMTAGYGLEGYTPGILATGIAPTSTVNGYKQFYKNEPYPQRNIFHVDEEMEVEYKIDMPDVPNPWRFGYAVDASWAPPINKPVDNIYADFTKEANCQEPYYVYVLNMGPGLTPAGGSNSLEIFVGDWLGTETYSPPRVECPELFEGYRTATLLMEYSDSLSEWRVEFGNEKSADFGTYRCLVYVEDNLNDPVSKPWLDLTAYNVIDVKVTEFEMEEVTPEWLNFSAEDIDVEGNFAYTIGGLGLQIFDISDPSAPTWVNSVSPPKWPTGVSVSDGYAYVLEYGSGTTILDIVDVDPPETASIVNSIEIEGTSSIIAVSDGYAYICVYKTITVVDIDPPETAGIINVTVTDSEIRDITVSGGYAYIAHSGSGSSNGSLEIYDIDPPASASSIVLVEVTGYIRGCVVSEGFAYLTTTDNMVQVVDVDPPESAYITGSFEAGGDRLAINDDFLFINDDVNLKIFNIVNPEFPYYVNTVTMPEEMEDMTAMGDYVYIASPLGFHVVDASSPGTAYISGSVDTPYYASGVEVSDGSATVVSKSDLQIIDVDPPEAASVIKTVDLPYKIDCFTTEGGYAYVADDELNLMIVDIDPVNMAHIINTVVMPWHAEGITVSGGYAYVSSGSFYIVDVDPPESAYIVNTVDIPGSVGNSEILGGYAYAVGGALHIIDIDPPETAFIQHTVEMPNSKNEDVAIADGYAYVSGYTALYVIDIDPPESAYISNQMDLPSQGMDVVISGNMLYVTEDYYGLAVVDIDPPGTAEIAANQGLLLSHRALDVDGNYGYLTSYYGLRILKLW